MPQFHLNPRVVVLLMLVSGWLAGCSTNPMPTPKHGGFIEREIVSDGARHRFEVFVPSPAVASASPPIILFLHGSGERGSDNRLQLDAGMGPYLRKHKTDFPALVVLPQAPADEEWIGANATMALAALDAATREFNGDKQRTYLTGLSMGGYATWELALMRPQAFAALVPICGAILAPSDERQLYVTQVASESDPYAALASQLKHVPIWIFHGAKDNVVSPADDRRTFAALKAAGGNVRYSELPDANHNSWDATYASDDMWKWMFAQHKE